jgi:hypothetical protein
MRDLFFDALALATMLAGLGGFGVVLMAVSP